MTSPESVGEVSVELLANAKKLSKSLKDQVEKGFKDLDPERALKDKIKKSKPIKLRVQPEPVKDSPSSDKPKKVPPAKVPVVVDPVLEAFQREVKRQVAALAKTINAEIPVGADTDGLRREISVELAKVQDQSRAKIPAEVADRGKYEADLRAAVAAVSDRVKASVKVEPDTTGLSAKVAAAADRADATVDVKVDVDKDGVSPLRGLFRDVAGAIQESIGSVASLGSSIASTLASSAGTILGATAAFGALTVAASLAVPVIGAVAGAIAAIPGALTGIGAAFSTLALGFKGISEAFKPSGGGGGGGGGAAGQAKQIAAASRQVEAARRGIAAANRQVEASERGLATAYRGVAEAESRLADAQKRATAAQAAISRARDDAAESIDDLNRSLRGALLSEEDAALGVEEALRTLNEVKLTGQIPDIKRADIAYRQALQTLEDAKDTTSDLTKETDAANKAGIEGSEQVQDAYADQADALKAVADAQIGVIEANNSLKSAQDGVAAAMDGVKSAADGLTSANEALAQAQQGVASGGGGVAKNLIKLAPAAQRFVDAIKSLKPAFESLRLDVQQRLFAGLDKTVTRLGQAWIPALRTTLGNYADTFNGFFQRLGENISKPKFIDDIQVGAEGARKGLEKIGTAISGPLVSAFGALSRASAPFIERFGDEIAKFVTEFSKWVNEGERTGKLQSFFEKASEALSDIFYTGKRVGAILGKIVGIITGESGKGANDSVIDSFNRELDKISAWLDKPENQQRVKDFVKDVGELAKNFAEAARWAAQVVGKINDLFGDDKEAPQAPQMQPPKPTGFKLKALEFFGWENGIDPGTSMMDGMMQGFQTGLGNLKKKLAGWFWEGPDSLVGRIKSGLGIASPSTLMIRIGGDLISGLVLGIGNSFARLRGRVDEIRTNILTRLQSAGTWLLTTGGNVVRGMSVGMQALFGTLRTKASEMKTKVVDTVKSAGQWLYNAGRAVIGGLIDGISSRIGTLGNYLRDIGQFIQDNKGPIEKDRIMLVGAGQAIMDGLIVGIGSRERQLGNKLGDVSAQIAAAALPALSDTTFGLGVDDAAITRSLQVAARSQVEITIDRSTTGDWLVDGLRRHITLSHGGDLERAIGGR